MNSVLLKIGFNTGIQITGKIVSVALSLFTVSLLTRYLGASGYGNFTLAFTYVSFFSVIADFGLQVAMIREFAEGTGRKSYGSFLIVKLSLVALSTVAGFVALAFFPYDTTVKVGISIAIFAVALSGITTYGTAIFQSRLRLDLVTLIDIVTKVFTVGLSIGFIYLKLNLFYIISAVLLGNLIGLVLTFILLKEKFDFSFNKNQIKEVVFSSLPIGLLSLAGLAYFKIDTILLSLMKSTADVGMYNLSYKVLENALLIWGFYMATVFPMFARFKGNKDQENIQRLLKNSGIVVFGLSLPIIMGVVIFAPFIIRILGGESFQESIQSLQILIFSLPFLFINNLLSDFLIVYKKHTIILVGIGFSLLLNICLNVIVIPYSGFIGASYVTVISALALFLYNSTALFLFFKNQDAGM